MMQMAQAAARPRKTNYTNFSDTASMTFPILSKRNLKDGLKGLGGR